jgi:hypothetical protein
MREVRTAVPDRVRPSPDPVLKSHGHSNACEPDGAASHCRRAAVAGGGAAGVGWRAAPASGGADQPCRRNFRTTMRAIALSVTLLGMSIVFMTFAWYAHLEALNHKPWFIAALVSWGIALAEYLLQVPANRIGYTVLSVGQLKIVQEAITLPVFVPFSYFYLREPLKLDYLWAALCILGAVFFIFRARWAGA